MYALNPGLNCFNLQVSQRLCAKPGTSALTTQASSSVQCSYFYSVKFGDSCLNIANYFGLSLTTLYTLNPSINCQGLTVGQSLCIINSSACSFQYTIQNGDS